MWNRELGAGGVWSWELCVDSLGCDAHVQHLMVPELIVTFPESVRGTRIPDKLAQTYLLCVHFFQSWPIARADLRVQQATEQLT